MRIAVEGNHPLRGSYRVSGSSNAALALIAGSMLSEAPSVLHNVPNTASVQAMLTVGQAIGLQRVGEANKLDLKPELTLHTPYIDSRQLDQEHADVTPGGLLFLAPILARRQHARLLIDGPLSRYNPHLTALRDLGCAVKVDGELIDVTLRPWVRREIILTQTSVTAT